VPPSIPIRQKKADLPHGRPRPPRAGCWRRVRPPSGTVAVAGASPASGPMPIGVAVGNHAAADRRQDRGAVFREVLGRWPDVAAMAQASLDDGPRMWAGLGYYSAGRSNPCDACAVAVLRRPWRACSRIARQGCALLAGIGPYTASGHCQRSRSIATPCRRRQYRAGGVSALCGSRATAAGQPRIQQLGANVARRRARWRREVSRRR